MLNAGSLFTLVAHSLLGLALGTVATSSPVANPAAPTPVAVATPVQLASNDDSSTFFFAAPEQDAKSAIQRAIEEVQASKDLKPELREKILKALRSALEISGKDFSDGMKFFRFDSKALPEVMPRVERAPGRSGAKKDVTLRVRGKDGKWKEFKNPTDAELKKLEDETRMRFRIRPGDDVSEQDIVIPKIDLRGLESLKNMKEWEGFRDLHKDLQFDFKLDEEAMKIFRRSMEEMRKSMREDIAPKSSDKVSRSRADIQRELERVRRERDELANRERVLRELLERMKDAPAPQAPRTTSV